MTRGASSFVSTIVLLALALTVVGAASCSSPVDPDDPLTVTLPPGGVAAYGRVVLTFVGATNDSRCPATALCVQQGDADVQIDVRTGGATARYVLRINDHARRSVVHAGYRITLDGLAPYPFTVEPIPAADYRATLTVARD